MILTNEEATHAVKRLRAEPELDLIPFNDNRVLRLKDGSVMVVSRQTPHEHFLGVEGMAADYGVQA